MASKKQKTPPKPTNRQSPKKSDKNTGKKQPPKSPKTRTVKPKQSTAKNKNTTKKNSTANKNSNKKSGKKNNKTTAKHKKTSPNKAKAVTKRSTWGKSIIRLCSKNRWVKRLVLLFTLIIMVIVGGFLLPQHVVIPVKDATDKDWHRNSFWFYPWGKSGVHRGIDIFAPVGRPVLASVSGIVVESGTRSMGGNVITILGAKWRLHYYAHLSEKHVRVGYWVNAGDIIGAVGTTGNAVGKTPHLHYSIRTIFPYVWRSDKTPYGSLKKWYINPTPYFHDYLKRHNDND